MSWDTNLTRIRRYLRDPDKSIWTDAQLKNLFNDAQRELQVKTRFLEDVRAVRVPPRFHFSYVHYWEWPLIGSETGTHRALRYHEQADIVFCYRWEPQAVWGLVAATAPDEGTHITHPWEAWLGGAPGAPIPIPLPHGFHEARLVAWDRTPIDALTLKEVQQEDPSWVGRMGKPFAYWRPDKTEDIFHLYPCPSSAVWEDDVGSGQVLHDSDAETVSAEVGAIQDYEAMITGSETGMVADVIESEDNALFVYAAVPTDLSGAVADESDFPEFMQKYVEQGAIERAYAADTDGQIKSLQEYWAWRKEIGHSAVLIFMAKRKADRDYRLVTHHAPGYRTRRRPRLPDEYPAVP